MSPDDPPEDLLDACKAGDPAAWRALFASRAAQVYRWAVFLGLRGPDAEDVAQDVLATAARRIHTCTSGAALPTWLFQITRRTAANARRRAAFRTLLRRDEPVPAFEHASGADAELELAVRACLARLPAAQVEVLVLAEIEGRTREEVAAMLSIPPGTVASRLRLARDAFRRCWDERVDAPPSRLSWEEP